MSTKLLKTILGNHYRLYLTVLLNCEVIEQVTQYRTKQARRYILSEKYRLSPYKFRPYKHPQVRRQVKKTLQEELNRARPFLFKYAPLISCLWDRKLQIDAPGAEAFYRHLLQECQHQAQRLLRPSQQLLLERSLPHRLRRVNRLLDTFQRYEHLPAVDANGRLYTLWAQMPEPLRNFVSYAGHSLAVIDVKNSQPFHLCRLFQSQFWATKAYRSSLKAIQPQLYKELEQKGVLSKIRDHVRLSGNSADVQLFLQLATSGQLYEALVERYSTVSRRFLDRQAAKQEFMMFMNFDLRYKESPRYKAYRTWAADFPNVATLFELTKELNYTYLSKMLHALEAKMLLVVVAGAFAKKNPVVPIGSVHDSLITLETKVGELQALIEKVYAREVGFVPNVEVKTLCQENAYRGLDKYIGRKLKPKARYHN